ncbi:hypothetical protein ACFYRC_15975 [Streptomyces sp. NPDC005279]|uniref:hypothetical protein n=1 Tax=Streptomyces sp. NPDC005279 TaxID=3364712 RepID=UPI0036B3A7D9
MTGARQKLGKERFDAEFDKAVKSTAIKQRAPNERTATAAKRLTKPAARELINALAVAG